MCENPAFNKQFDKENRALLNKFLRDTEKYPDDISGSVIATITQFIMCVRDNISAKAHDRGWLSTTELLESQIDELRKCITDLEMHRQRLTNGVTVQ